MFFDIPQQKIKDPLACMDAIEAQVHIVTGSVASVQIWSAAAFGWYFEVTDLALEQTRICASVLSEDEKIGVRLWIWWGHVRFRGVTNKALLNIQKFGIAGIINA